MIRYPLPALALTVLAAPLAAQEHDHSAHAPAAPREAAPEQAMDHRAVDRQASDHEAMNHGEMNHGEMNHGEMNHEAMNHGAMDHGAMNHATMDHSGMDHSAHGTAVPETGPAAHMAPAGDETPPARAFEGPRHAADSVYGAAVMAPARRQLAAENGAMTTGRVLAERLEARLGGENGFVWDLDAFYGGDLDRFALKSEGEGSLKHGGSVEDAEIQALWSHAIGPFLDLQAGARLDIEPDTRAHAVLGLQGLAPYMIHFDSALFLSDRGDLTARVEAEYDQKITQRLILQPRIEIQAAAQDIAERDIAAGLTGAEAGLRLRYEIAREFAPYVGVGWETRLGGTADIARASGEDVSGFAALLGLRAWF